MSGAKGCIILCNVTFTAGFSEASKTGKPPVFFDSVSPTQSERWRSSLSVRHPRCASAIAPGHATGPAIALPCASLISPSREG